MPEGSSNDRHAATDTAEHEHHQPTISRQRQPQRRRRGVKRAALRRFAAKMLRCLEDRSNENANNGNVAAPTNQTHQTNQSGVRGVPLVSEAGECNNSVQTSIVQVAPTATIRSAVSFLQQALVMLDGLEELPPPAVVARQQLRSAVQQLEVLHDNSVRSGHSTELLLPPPRATLVKSVEEKADNDVCTVVSAPTDAVEACNAVAQHDHEVSVDVQPALTAPTHSTSQATDGNDASSAGTPEEMARRVGSDDALSPALNSLVVLLWPRIKEYVSSLLRTDIEPAINEALPSMFRGAVKFTSISLGEKCPCLGPMRVERRPNSDDIEVQLGVRFDSDLNVELTAAGVAVGVCRILLEGQLVAVLGPAMAAPPFFGGVQVFFANPPQLDLHFLGAARVADIPGLRGAVRAAVAAAIAGVCVLPRRIAVDLNEDDAVDLVDLTFPEPMGILRFTLHAGRDLIGDDINVFGPRTSDPYVVATLGCKSWTSPKVLKCLNPTWGDDGVGLAVDFPVHCRSQQLHLKVFDWDFSSSDDLIGVAKSLAINELLTASQGTSGVATTEVPLLSAAGETGAGRLVVSAEWLELRTVRPEAPLQGPSVAHLSAKMLRASGIPGGMEAPFHARLRVVASSATAAVTAPAGATEEVDDNKSENSSGQVPHRPSLLGTMAKGIASLRSSKTSPRPSSATVVCAEATTSASHQQDSVSLAEELQRACAALAARGESADEIATLLGIERQLVDRFQDIQRDSEKMCKVAKEVALVNALARPCFDEVLQLLLPPSVVQEEHVLVELALLDKHQKCAGCLQLPICQAIDADGLCLEGPFLLDGGAQLTGSLLLRWLE